MLLSWQQREIRKLSVSDECLIEVLRMFAGMD